METPLTKSQLCWTIIRLVGLYFLVHAASTLVILISAIFISGAKYNISFASIPAANAKVFVFIGIFSILIPLILGIYLLRSGRLIHRCLMWESGWFQDTEQPSDSEPGAPRKRRGQPDPSTTLTPGETARFKEWLERNPQFQSRPQADQIALFRDAQRESPELRDE